MNSLTPERFMIDDTLMEKDYDYLQHMAPVQSQPLFDIMEDFCDRLEYEGSFLYDECPDKTTILTLTDKIHEKLTEKDSLDLSLKDFIQTILCNEILYRRCRYYRKKKMFE